MWNHSEPIWVSLRHLSPGTDPVAAQWSLPGLEREGGWSQDGCQLVHTDSSTSTLRCTVLSNYAVLQVRAEPFVLLIPNVYSVCCDSSVTHECTKSDQT